MSYYLRLFGGIALDGPFGTPSGGAAQQRPLAVLALLAAAHPHGCTRDKLVGYLWPESDQGHARHRLADVLYLIRKALGEDAIAIAGENVRLSHTAVESDVAAFLDALDAGDLESAARHYHGSFLDGFALGDAPEFERWLESERRRLGDRYAGALQSLAASARARGDHVAETGWWKQLLSHDPYNSRFALGLIEALALSGDPANAWLALRDHERLLREDLKVEPAADLRRRAEEIIRATVARAGSTAPEPASAEVLADRVSPVTQSGKATAPPLPVTAATRPAPVGALLSGPRWRLRAVLGTALLVLVVGAVALSRWPQPSGGSRHPRTTIAVLPFDNLSGEGPNAYFAGGLHDELLTQLAKVAALKVIGRTSVTGYAGTTKRPREIGEELAVGSIVEGSVQVVGNRLRVTVQLIDPVTEAHLWAERYDRTLDDAFAVQSDIAQQIVAAVGGTLGGTERAAIAKAPTTSPNAYQLYLQGLEYYRRPGYKPRNLGIAQDLFEHAVALDPTFALAYAALSEVHGRMSWFRYDTSPERLVRQRETAEAALRLAPNLPQAHLAMGIVHYYGRRDWDAALREYQVALTGLPNDAELWRWIGYAHRRLGNWKEVFTAWDRVMALDPRNADYLWDLGAGTLEILRRYQEAVEWYTRAQALAPDVPDADLHRGWAWIRWQGRLDSLRAALMRIGLVSQENVESVWAELFLYERNADSVLALLRRTTETVFADQVSYLPTALYAAWAYELRGENAVARTAFDSARVFLDSVVTVLPGDWRVHAARGLALAGLGRRQEARREAQWLKASAVYRNDRYWETNLTEDRGWILARTGDRNEALAEIERLLAGPSLVSAPKVRLDPRWDAIRNDPRFQALLVKYTNPGP